MITREDYKILFENFESFIIKQLCYSSKTDFVQYLEYILALHSDPDHDKYKILGQRLLWEGGFTSKQEYLEHITNGMDESYSLEEREMWLKEFGDIWEKFIE
jgi:hypothetical protein